MRLVAAVDLHAQEPGPGLLGQAHVQELLEGLGIMLCL